MSNFSKEQLTRGDQKTVDEIALQEVNGYVERVEGSTERTLSDSQQNQSYNQSQQTSQPSVAKVSVNPSKQEEIKNIVLPIGENEVRFGLVEKPNRGIRWLAEWCLMMIKKYPGRVFYSPTSYD